MNKPVEKYEMNLYKIKYQTPQTCWDENNLVIQAHRSFHFIYIIVNAGNKLKRSAFDFFIMLDNQQIFSVFLPALIP